MPLGRVLQEEFRGGEQRDFAPHLIDPRAVYKALNSMLDDDGSIYRRGGSVSVSNAPFGSALRGVWEGWLQGVRRTFLASSSAFGVLAADGVTPVKLGGAGFATVPKPMHAIQDLLFVGGGTIYGGSRMAADYSTGTATLTKGSKVVTGAGTKWAANVDVGMLLRHGEGERVYPVAEVNSDTQLTLRDAYEGETKEGTAYTLKRLEAATAPYIASDIYAIASKRLIVCERNIVKFSEPDKPHVYEAKIAPLETVVQNRHELEEGTKILAAESIGVDRAQIFTTTGITMISNLALSIVDGQGNSQHRIDKLSGEVLWGNGAGIASYSGSLVVPTMEDVFLMDGTSSPTALGQSIMPRLREYAVDGLTPGGAFVFRNHYFLPLVDPSGVPQALEICRLDRPLWLGRHIPMRWPWSMHNGSGAKISAGVTRPASSAGDAPRALAAASDGLLVDLRTFFEPSAAVKNDHDGTTHLWEVITRDYPGGQTSLGRFRRLRLLYELEAASGDAPRIYAEVGLGIRKPGEAEWDVDTWDDFEWVDPEESEFDLLEEPGPAPPNAGAESILSQNAWTWYLKTHARYARFRLQSSDPAAKLTLRTIEVFVAQAGGIRQGKVV